MDKLEQYKAANPNNDAIVDDVAAKAYIESFALETFDRADGSQRSNKVTAQTADTFQAANTFMDLLTIWGPLDSEITAKKKFAKFHAVRIAKAIKAGEDPNAGNPILEPPPAPVDTEVGDSVENELKELERQFDAGNYRQPTVESAPESRIPSRPQSSLRLDPAAAPELSVKAPNESQAEPDVSPIEPSEQVNSRAGSVGGGYFPSVPVPPTNLQPSDFDSTAPAAASPHAPADPSDFYSVPPPASMPSQADLGIGTPNRPSRTTPDQVHPEPPTLPSSYAMPPPSNSLPKAQPLPAPQPVPAAVPAGGYNDDDDAIADATKHAKWAISALNFEDVSTAVKELRIALQALGAS